MLVLPISTEMCRDPFGQYLPRELVGFHLLGAIPSFNLDGLPCLHGHC